jgi:hypothetical protein
MTARVRDQGLVGPATCTQTAVKSKGAHAGKNRGVNWLAAIGDTIKSITPPTGPD